jgi:predicted nucleic acid-binding Zn ribbon protein
VASLHRPAALLPAVSEFTQLAVAGTGVRESAAGDHDLADRIHDCQRVARLVRIDADHHIVIHHIAPPESIRQDATRRAMQLPAAQTSLEPQPRRADPVNRRPFVSQNATNDDGSRFASELTEPNACE